jgi:hypothetical protein
MKIPQRLINMISGSINEFNDGAYPLDFIVSKKKNKDLSNIFYYIIMILFTRDKVKKIVFHYILLELKVSPYYFKDNKRNETDGILTYVWKELKKNKIIDETKVGTTTLVSLSEEFLLNYAGGYWPKLTQINDYYKPYVLDKTKSRMQYRYTVEYIKSFVIPTIFRKKSYEVAPIMNERDLNYFLALFYTQQTEMFAKSIIDELYDNILENRKFIGILDEVFLDKKNKIKNGVPIDESRDISYHEVLKSFVAKARKISDEKLVVELNNLFRSYELKKTLSGYRKLCFNLQLLESKGKEDTWKDIDYYKNKIYHSDYKKVFPFLYEPREGMSKKIIKWMQEKEGNKKETKKKWIFYYYEPLVMKLINDKRKENKNLHLFYLNHLSTMVWDEFDSLRLLREFKGELPIEVIKQNPFIFEQIGYPEGVRLNEDLTRTKKVLFDH